MPREREGFRDQLERLDAAFPGRELIRKAEIAGWLGIDKRALERNFKMPPGVYISKVAVARMLC